VNHACTSEPLQRPDPPHASSRQHEMSHFCTLGDSAHASDIPAASRRFGVAE
jgi:hypothetical protein